MEHFDSHPFFDALSQRLHSRPTRRVNLPGLTLRESAVLVPLHARGGRPHVVFTQRPTHLRTHAGQFAFPGGTRDPSDASPEATALREAHEELGIPPEGVRVLGALDEVSTLTEFRIQPVVGVIAPDLVYVPSAHEVALILELPLAHFLDPAVRRTELRSAHGRTYEVDFYSYGEHVIWGATARILRNLLAAADGLPGLAR
ncbi:CoA pyrophosphatase [Aggregicoccus sp. 17bor-14]|uniref:CoA pyrophosphatase n=1 Tax=Myxococcaceae TaxID=31 RepID=UPI0012F132A6|nr:CoA pyrophosphatase [Simulacricoccus sp. 17bor-14]MRI91871.1 CoA pyrophosphatase [Aggregicoccus sp. 17bor-14]